MYLIVLVTHKYIIHYKIRLFSTLVPATADPWYTLVKLSLLRGCIILDTLLTSGSLSFFIYKVKIILSACYTIKKRTKGNAYKAPSVTSA